MFNKMFEQLYLKKLCTYADILLSHTGKEIGQLLTNSSVRTCNFSYSGNIAVYSTDKALGHQCEMFIIDTRTIDPVLSQEDAICRTSIQGPRISAILWGAMDETIITGHEDGEINIWDCRVIHKFISDSFTKLHKVFIKLNKLWSYSFCNHFTSFLQLNMNILFSKIM